MERLRDYCLFVTFFPQLVAGPIVLYSEMIPQFKDESKRYFIAESFAAGLYIFAIGLFKKAVIADTVALFADNGFGSAELSFAAGWATALSYTLQIYFDFSGYSDMAVGLGKMFNIELLQFPLALSSGKHHRFLAKMAYYPRPRIEHLYL